MKNFLKSDRHLHKDEAVRLDAISEFDAENPEHQSLLELMVVADESMSVRKAAMMKVVSFSRLNQALITSDDPALTEVAAIRMGELAGIEAHASSLDGFMVNASDAACEIIAAMATDAGVRQRALSKISDDLSLVRIVQAAKFHDTRQAAAEKLVSHDSLRAALTASRSRDKEVARYIQHRLDVIAKKEASERAAQSNAAETAASMKTLASSVWSPQTKGRYDALLARWSSLEGRFKDAQQSEFDQARNSVEAILAESASKLASPSELHFDGETTSQSANPAASSSTDVQGNGVAVPATGAKTDSAAKQAGAIADAASESVAATPVPPTLAVPTVPVVPDDEPIKSIKVGLAVDTLDELPAKLSALKTDEFHGLSDASENVKKLLAHAAAVAVLFDPPFEINSARVNATKERTTRVSTLLDVNKLLATIDLNGLSYLDLLAVHKEDLAARLGKAKQESEDRVKATHRQFSALSGIVKEGKWGPASSMFRRLQKKINAMDPGEKAIFNDKLSRAEEELNTMGDWQDFAARPKLEALCERMEALPGQELAPDDVAKEVRSLQNEWKSLGVSRASNDLWSRFKTAGDVAYEPCKAYFDEKQKERQEKVSNKKQICDLLEASIKEVDLNAESVDWKGLQKLANDAKRDWSRNRVTDRKPDRKLEERFTLLLKPIEAKLAEQYDANAAEKADLIEKITKLATGEINQHAANQARSLQANWKSVGITRRKEDQGLWEQFNEQCRTIFKTIKDSEREKYKASMGHVFRAKDIIKSLRQNAKSGELEDAGLQALITEFNGLAEFPERDKKFLLRDFRAALDANSKRQETKTRQKRQQVFDEIKRCVGLCEQLEEAVESPQMMTGTLIEEVTDSWEATDIVLPKEWSVPLMGRRNAAIEHLKASTQYDYTKTESARRDLLIRIEVLADVETPAEDKSLRMQFQLANLQQGMTASVVADKKSELKSLERTWLTMPPASIAKRDGLNSRYLKAMKG